MSFVILNANPEVHLDVLNRKDNEDIETLATINLGCTRNDASLELSVPFTVTHGSQIPLYNLRWAKLKSDPAWVDNSKTKLVWTGLPAPVPPTLPIWVYKLDGLNVPSVEDFLNSLPKLPGLELPDLNNIFKIPFQDISFALPKINIGLPNFDEVYKFFKDIDLGLNDFFTKWTVIDPNNIIQFKSFIDLNGLQNLLTNNPLYNSFSWLLDKIKSAAEKGITDIWSKAESIINVIVTWTNAGIEAAKKAITDFFDGAIKELSKIKFDNLLNIPGLNLNPNQKNWLQGFGDFGDPLWILKELSKITESIVNITVNIIQAIFNWTLQKATKFWNYLQTIPGLNLDELKNIWPKISLSFPSFNLQLYEPVDNLIQFPLAGTPLPPPPIGPFINCVYPQVAWPSWMTTPDFGIATIPTQIPPGVPAGMPPVFTPNTMGVIAFQSLPGFVYNGELKIKTVVDIDSSKRPVGLQTFDLYLLANSDPAGLLPAGNNTSGAVARVRFIVDFQDPNVAISVNPKRENPTIVKNYKVVSFVYDPDVSQTYTFDVPVTQLIYAQGVTTQDIQMSTHLSDYPDLLPTSPYDYLSNVIPKANNTTFIRNLDGSITPENLISVLAVNKIYYYDNNNTKIYLENNNWAATEITPIIIENKLIRIWVISLGYKPENVHNVYLVCDVLKTVNDLPVINSVMNLQESGFTTGVIVASIEYSNNNPVKLFDNTNLPWTIIGTLFDSDINTGPSNEQAVIEANKISTKRGNYRGYDDKNRYLGDAISTHQADLIFRNVYLKQSYLYHPQMFSTEPKVDLGKLNKYVTPIITDYYTFTKKPAYQNDSLTTYIRNLLNTINNILKNKGISFRLNTSIYAWLAPFQEIDLFLNGTYAAAEVTTHNIAISPSIVLTKPTPFSTNEQIIDNLDIFIKHVFIHEIVHTSMSEYITYFFDLDINGVNGVEIFTEYITTLIMGFLYPEKLLLDPLYFTKGAISYPRFPNNYITDNNIINAAFAVASTSATNFVAVKEVIKSATNVDEEFLLDDRRLPITDNPTFHSFNDVLQWYKSFHPLDPNKPTIRFIKFIENSNITYPMPLLALYTSKFNRINGKLIYNTTDTWVINNDGVMVKIGNNGELL